jgi:uncharacterized protein involved in tolerance to divalent cations
MKILLALELLIREGTSVCVRRSSQYWSLVDWRESIDQSEDSRIVLKSHAITE